MIDPVACTYSLYISHGDILSPCLCLSLHHLLGSSRTTKAFQCQECPRSYSSKYALVRHARQHTNSHLRACVFCGRTSTRADIIRVHMMNCVKKYVKAPVEKEGSANLQDPQEYLLAITKLMEAQAGASGEQDS